MLQSILTYYDLEPYKKGVKNENPAQQKAAKYLSHGFACWFGNSF